MKTRIVTPTAFAAAVLSLALTAAAPARAAPAKSDLVRASLVADADAAAPGHTFTLGVRLTMKAGWHTYWVNPGESGQPTLVRLTGPEGFDFGEPQWPIPTRFEHDGTTTFGYEGEVLLLVPVTVSTGAAAGGSAAIEADLAWLSCKGDTCIEGAAKPTISLPVRATAGSANREVFDAARRQLPVAADQPPAAAVVKRIEQAVGAGAAPLPQFVVEWKGETPRKVQWFPAATDAVAINDVAVEPAGPGTTAVRYKPNVYKADKIPGNKVDGVLVYEDENGRRQGVTAAIRVPTGKPAE